MQVIDTNLLGNDRANMVDNLEETKSLNFSHIIIFDGRLYQSFQEDAKKGTKVDILRVTHVYFVLFI